VTTLLQVRNIFVIFLVSGFWHGANWTFIVWGGLNAVFFLPSLITVKNRNHLEVVAKGRTWPNPKEFFSILATFTFTTFAWIFFRAENMDHAVSYLSGIFSNSLFTLPNLTLLEGVVPILVLILLFIILEWRGRESDYALREIGTNSTRTFRWSMYTLLIMTIDVFGKNSAEIEFIYFQF
jgi:D-alanyl-lipoteichoic acid acyltransferase DltB (MBOAT superfamily)